MNDIEKIHIIGIEGAGTSALARILKRIGKDVSGSDEGDHFYFPMLEGEGIAVSHQFSAENIPADADLIIYGSAFKQETNPELKAAMETGKKLMTYSEALASVFNEKYGIAVCGTHGKSTTSAWLSYVLKMVGRDPSAVIGAKVPQLEGNSIIGQSEYFVIEADEYQNKLQYYFPKATILTSVDWDHPDFFPDTVSYKKVFADFVAKIPRTGILSVWGDSIDTLEATRSAVCQVVRYGFTEENDLRIINLKNILPGEKGEPASQKFTVIYENEDLGEFEIRLLGRHNALNAAGIVGLCLLLNIPTDDIKKALGEFNGTNRRLEFVGEKNGALIFDDYGHHPEEVKATLKTVRENYPEKNVIAVFHPHSFTRTEALLQEFAQSFDDADRVIILDIYGSARETSGNVSSSDLVNLINKYYPGKGEHIPGMDEAYETLKDNLSATDLLLTIGAGDVWKLAHRLKEEKMSQ
jgi:UDP-N-acetylmuramate--alanine ligase